MGNIAVKDHVCHNFRTSQKCGGGFLNMIKIANIQSCTANMREKSTQ